MPNQEESRDGIPRKDADRPSPDVERNSIDGQSGTRGKGREYRGDGPGKVGLASDGQPDLVAPSGVNERDHGAADDKPMAGGSLNFEDGDMAHPRGNTAGQGGTWNEAKPGDAGDLGAPGAGLSDRNGPSDPDGKDIGIDPGDPSAKKVG